MSLDVDLLRPVLSMPPVILMDSGSPQSSPRLNIHSVPPSPIVDFPPSPAPSQQPVVEFPDEEIYEYDEDGFVVEVRKKFLLWIERFSSVVTNELFGRHKILTKCMKNWEFYKFRGVEQ